MWHGDLKGLRGDSIATLRQLLDASNGQVLVCVHPFYEGLFAEDGVGFPSRLWPKPRFRLFDRRTWFRRAGAPDAAWNSLKHELATKLGGSGYQMIKRATQLLSERRGIIILLEERQSFESWSDPKENFKIGPRRMFRREITSAEEGFSELNPDAHWVVVQTFNGSGVPFHDRSWEKVPLILQGLGVRRIEMAGGLFRSDMPVCGTTAFIALHASQLFESVELLDGYIRHS